MTKMKRRLNLNMNNLIFNSYATKQLTFTFISLNDVYTL